MSKDHENGDDLWSSATRDVKKLGARDKAAPDIRRKRIKLTNRADIETALPDITLPVGGGIDRNTADKVRKGEIRIEARLDLHGLNIDAARLALLQFIKTSHASGKRCVLAITGKGKSDGAFSRGTGAIRREFPFWLEDASIRPYILSSAQAVAKHGGSGAFYIYLRKTR